MLYRIIISIMNLHIDTCIYETFFFFKHIIFLVRTSYMHEYKNQQHKSRKNIDYIYFLSILKFHLLRSTFETKAT